MSVAGVMYRHIALKASVRENDQCLMSIDWQSKPCKMSKTQPNHNSKEMNDVMFADEIDGVFIAPTVMVKETPTGENVYPQFPDFFVQSRHIFLLPLPSFPN